MSLGSPRVEDSCLTWSSMVLLVGNHPDVKEVSDSDLAILYENKIASELDPAAPVRHYQHENASNKCLP